ncbi:Rqc2 family fibronectin-binding protein [Kamptonema formosum]|uniref:Rqc2 family fibronectin-binding protein n=1 Tax=Kamptonema formosum TaxID=331992 RepID=UPI0003468A4A|nr:NFACT RNA binding domain-containing protein [Oscillatoria sp. PCC 10802]
MRTVDFTTLTAACSELRATWLPARLEQVYQRDRHTIAIAVRTLDRRGWLDISWHPQAARLCTGSPPPRTPDTFTFSQQLRHQLAGLALVAIEAIAPWERVADLQFARRPGEEAIWHLYVEIMGKYSNVILANQDNLIVTAGHQVSDRQSRVRPIQTGQPYEVPPALLEPIPSSSESFDRWRERVSLIPGQLGRQLLKSYRGLSSSLVESMVRAAGLDPQQPVDTLSDGDWHRLFSWWLEWLHALEKEQFQPMPAEDGYTVIGWGAGGAGDLGLAGDSPIQNPKSKIQNDSPPTVGELLNRYYTEQLNQQEFKQLRHQLSQKISSLLGKLQVKAGTFQERLQQSDQADRHRQQADLLMANLQAWQPGMKSIALPDFETGEPVAIALEPEKNAVQNAQALYRRHQKLKRARAAVEPLLAEVREEIEYLELVEMEIAQLEGYREPADLKALEEIRDELIGQGYLENPEYRSQTDAPATDFYRYRTPSGFELLVGRNNRQNDILSFRMAGDYDLWFHTQEIAGSHALLRLPAGAAPEEADLQFAADVTAHYSRAREAAQVPVVYTEPKHVYKPKGAKPGMVVYKHERILWGRPQEGRRYVNQMEGSDKEL